MLLRELRCRGNFYWNASKGTIEKAGQGDTEELAPYYTPPANGECLIFTKLSGGKYNLQPLGLHPTNNSPEIRAMILRILFVRPNKIVPGPVRYAMKICYRDTNLNIYSYVWGARRQSMYDEHNLPHYDGASERVTKEWATNATDAQLAMIENGEIEVDARGECKLPKTFDPDLNANVNHYVCRRGAYPTKIVNKAGVYTTGILGVDILSTCKRFHLEGAPLLYGENKFDFDTRGQSPFTHRRGVHEYDSLDNDRYLVPGLANDDGTPQARHQTLNAMNRMFDYRSMHQPFMRRDPLATFLRTIGRTNSSYITDITIEGYFKTSEHDWRFRNNRPITFAHILPIHSTMLKHATPSLTKLAIYQGYNNALWEDDLEGQLGMSDEERYDDVIGKVVNALPGLRSLDLANYYFDEAKEAEEGEEKEKQQKAMARPWGKALRWEGIVDARYRQHKKELRLRAERETKRLEMAQLEQYIWKEDRGAGRGGRGSRGGRGGGGFQNQASKGESSSNAARYNASFAALVDNAAAAAAESDGAGPSGARPSFKRGKKLARGENTVN
jgi:hypothetical protein